MLLSFVLMYFNLCYFNRNSSKFENYLLSIISWSSWLYFGTEILSVNENLRFTYLILWWGALNIVLGLFFCKNVMRKDFFHSKSISQFKVAPRNWFLLILFLVAIVLASITVPYNWDSMTYHLPRIAHWAQNETVAHYATNSIRQITSPPMAEFINLHIYILTNGNDRLFNMLQCISYITNSIIIYNLARKIKCKVSFAYLAMFLFLSMPIAFSEALTTQVDHFATLWMLIFAYCLVDFCDFQEKITFCRKNILKVVMMSFCVGFGYLTKPTVSVAMFILLLWLLIICIVRRDKIWILLRLIFCTIPIILIIMIPEIVRNYTSFAAISAPIAGQRQLVGTLNPLYLLVNFMKNFSFNLPNIYLYRSEDVLYKVIEIVSNVLNVELNHPSISEDGRLFFIRSAPEYGHDTAISSTILILLIVCILMRVFWMKKKNARDIYKSFSFVAIFSFFIICAIFRWNPFISRYMLSYLAMICPIVAFQIQQICERFNKKHITWSICSIVCFMCMIELSGAIFYNTNLCLGGVAS